MDAQTPPESPTPPVESGKKPLPTGAKVGIGCGVLALIGVIVIILLMSWCKRTFSGYIKDFSENPERATAELVIKMNPELDLVESNDVDSTITFRDKSSGKETTMSWTDIAEGRLTISDSEGNQMTFGAADMESVPAWVPRLPQSTQLASSYHTVENGKVTGAYMASTPMATADLVSFFAEQAQALGMESTLDTQHSAGTQEMRMIGYKQGDRGYSVNIVREGTGDANVQVMYEDVAGN